ncbi:hypothetical protein SLS58_003135 [Diplodia intermedia]|uniref:BTB domain-containing protein n=1 Tax=Diplodia intermedia TaxID=856260 RepID=A0ABR3TX26_9PEZI
MSDPDPKLQSTLEDEEEDIASLPTREQECRQLLRSKYLADVTIVCADGQEIMAHSHLLVCHSVYFKNAFKSGMQVSDILWSSRNRGADDSERQESKGKRFKFEDSSSDPHLNFSHDAVYCALQYLYSGSCKEHQGADAFLENIRLHVDLHVLGDYFGIGGLQEYATDRFGEITKDWIKLKPALPDVIKVVYDKPLATVSGLRPKLVAILAQQGRRLSCADMGDCVDTIRKYSECATDVMLKIFEREVKVRCRHCRNSFTVVEGERKKSYFHCLYCGHSLLFDEVYMAE